MAKYLYGASIQGIQSFIFQTNKLKEIIGASEIIEDISTNYFTEFLGEQNISEENYEKIIMAAGNIKFIFNNEDDIKKVVKYFPKAVMEQAYGITISQAVAKFTDKLVDDINKLESKLKISRNKVELPLDLSLNIIKNAPRTGRSGIDEVLKNKNKKDKEIIDKATKQKQDEEKRGKYHIIDEKMKQSKYKFDFAREFEEISNEKNKIAVVHADGNGLGKILQKMGKDNKSKEDFIKFSKDLNTSTEIAVRRAFEEIFKKELKELDTNKKDKIKFRTIVLGGDDFTFICDANKAIKFTEKYLEYFEEETGERLGNKLTAAAGIAYCNEKYPFHYAVDLAETLCSEAKKRSNREHSCLMFHNIQSSFYTSFSDYKDNELIIESEKYKQDEKDDNKKKKIYEYIELDFGPYYVDTNLGTEKPSIKDFRKLYNEFKKENSPISSLRNWLSELYSNKEHAQSTLNRINQMAEEGKYDVESLNDILAKFDKNMKLDNLIVNRKNEKGEVVKKTVIYDVLQIKSIND